MNTQNNEIEKVEVIGVVASILRAYVGYEYIDFVQRSGAAKGTIDWSEYVARSIENMENTCYPSFYNLLSRYGTAQREAGKKEANDVYYMAASEVRSDGRAQALKEAVDIAAMYESECNGGGLSAEATIAAGDIKRRLQSLTDKT